MTSDVTRALSQRKIKPYLFSDNDQTSSVEKTYQVASLNPGLRTNQRGVGWGNSQ